MKLPDKQKVLKEIKSYIPYLKYFLLEMLFFGVVLAADLLTKEYVYGYADTHGKIKLIKDVLSFTAVTNTGASFGIFGDSTAALTVVSLVCAIVLFVFILISVKTRHPLLRSALVLILAGAVGNMVDRFAFGYVRDFIYFELIDFAVFNVADSALTVGTILLIIYIIFFYKVKEDKDKKAKEIAKPVSSEKQESTAEAESAPSQNASVALKSESKDENSGD